QVRHGTPRTADRGTARDVLRPDVMGRLVREGEPAARLTRDLDHDVRTWRDPAAAAWSLPGSGTAASAACAHASALPAAAEPLPAPPPRGRCCSRPRPRAAARTGRGRSS